MCSRCRAGLQECSSVLVHADLHGGSRLCVRTSRLWFTLSHHDQATSLPTSSKTPQSQATSPSPGVLPLSRGCERTRTCPGGSSVARPAEQSPVSGLRAGGQPDKSLPGHIPQSEPAALQLLATCPHWCMCSAQENSQKSTR